MHNAHRIFLLGACLAALAARAAAGAPVETRRVEQVDDFFGTPVADPYRWLENVDDPEVQRWVEAQNERPGPSSIACRRGRPWCAA